MIESVEANGQHWKRVEPVPVGWAVQVKKFDGTWATDFVLDNEETAELLYESRLEQEYICRIVALYQEAEDED